MITPEQQDVLRAAMSAAKAIARTHPPEAIAIALVDSKWPGTRGFLDTEFGQRVAERMADYAGHACPCEEREALDGRMGRAPLCDNCRLGETCYGRALEYELRLAAQQQRGTKT